MTLVAILVRPARPRAHMLLLLGRLYGGGVWRVWREGEGGGTKPLLFLLQSREATPIASKGREDAGQGRSQQLSQRMTFCAPTIFLCIRLRLEYRLKFGRHVKAEV